MIKNSLKLFSCTGAIVLGLSSFALAGTITGKVTYEGKHPKLREIKMDADPICLGLHSTTVYPQTITLSENSEMINVFVHVVSGLPKKKYPVPSEPKILDQAGCMYTPSVFGLMVGQPLKILNPDGTLHNVHSMSKKNPEFNIAMPKFRKEVSKTFKKKEFMFPIKCDVHPWMVAWASVLDHPYFDVSDEVGNFTIENLPAGEYVIEAWQQRLDPKRENITIAEGETKEVNFTFSRPDGK